MASIDDSSILSDVKKVLGIHPSIDEFDLDIIMHINSAFATLWQLGVGPLEPFHITDDKNLWKEFTVRKDLSGVRSYIVAKVRMAFDPPANSFTQDAVRAQITEYEFRLNVAGEREVS